MSEVYKITNMLVTEEDIKHIDKNWQSIIDEYTKTLVREKDLVITQYLMKKQKEEIERLKNMNEEHRILNGELRKELQQKENIIKEVKEYITYARTPRTIYESGYGKGTCVEICMEHLLEILGEGE